MPIKPPTSSTRFLQLQQRVTSAAPRSRVEGLSSSLNTSSTGSKHIQNPLRNSSHSNTQPLHNYRQQQQTRSHFVAVMALSSTQSTTRGYTGPPPTIEHHDSNGPAAAWSSTGAQRTASGSRYHSPNLSGLSGGVREKMTGTGAGLNGSIVEPKMTTEMAVIPKEFPGFEVTPIPKELSKAKPIRTAAALVIGDEILNGKTMEKNSHYFAKYCFDLGIDL